MIINDYGKIVSKNLKRIAYEKGKTQAEMSRDLDIPKTTISSWMNGVRIPKMQTIDMFCEYFGVRRSDIMDPYDKSEVYAPKGMIPLYSAVSAGTGAFADGNIEGYIPLPPEYEGKGEHFALKIKGNSMEPLIMDGDSVIVRKGDTAENGKIVIAVVNGNEGFCKKLVKYKNSIGLISNNPDYDPMIFTNEEVKNTPVRILGTVMALNRKL